MLTFFKCEKAGKRSRSFEENFGKSQSRHPLLDDTDKCILNENIRTSGAAVKLQGGQLIKGSGIELDCSHMQTAIPNFFLKPVPDFIY